MTTLVIESAGFLYATANDTVPRMNDTATRRLAAILAADVVGYSRLIEADEAATLAQLKALKRDIIDPQVAAHRGRVFKTMGDGFLAEFASVVDAVACAAAIQRANASASSRVELRIGVNLGDVVVDGDDLLGDGVNIAARLEGIADPGGLCISGAAHEHLKGKLDLAFDDLGPQRLKNLAQLVPVFRARLDDAAALVSPPPTRLAVAVAGVIAALATLGWVVWVVIAPGSVPPTPAKQTAPAGPVTTTENQRPALIVLPFANLSNDPEQEYFADGFTEDLTTALSRFPGFLVMGRNTAFTFKGKAVDAQKVGRELGVRYVLERSVRKQGDQLRLNAQLIDTVTGAHVWAEKYDRPMAEIFIAQDEIADMIVSLVASNIRIQVGKKALAAPVEKLEAYELTMRARLLRLSGSRDDTFEARRLLELAIARDQKYAPAYTFLTFALGAIYVNPWNDEYGNPATLEKIATAGRKAVELAPDDGLAHISYSAALRTVGRWNEMEAETAKAFELAPNDLNVLTSGALNMTRIGRFEQSESFARRALQLDPLFPALVLQQHLSSALFHQEKYLDATQVARA